MLDPDTGRPAVIPNPLRSQLRLATAHPTAWLPSGLPMRQPCMPKQPVCTRLAEFDASRLTCFTCINQCRQYRLPVDTGKPGDMFPRFSRAGTPTLRWPAGPAFASSNVRALNASVLRNRCAQGGGAGLQVQRLYPPRMRHVSCDAAFEGCQTRQQVSMQSPTNTC